jgi:inositol phosphorylceramide mannosyltransferase catalytic subunit
MGNDTTFLDNIPNAFMTSEPEHGFWLACLHDIMDAQLRGVHTAEHLTGPVMLKRVLNNFWWPLNLTGLTILPPWTMYPFDWNAGTAQHKELCYSGEKDDFTGTECKRFFPNAYAITYWEHSWSGDEA